MFGVQKRLKLLNLFDEIMMKKLRQLLSIGHQEKID